jgi:hypothetical protein
MTSTGWFFHGDAHAKRQVNHRTKNERDIKVTTTKGDLLTKVQRERQARQQDQRQQVAIKNIQSSIRLYLGRIAFSDMACRSLEESFDMAAMETAPSAILDALSRWVTLFFWAHTSKEHGRRLDKMSHHIKRILDAWIQLDAIGEFKRGNSGSMPFIKTDRLLRFIDHCALVISEVKNRPIDSLSIDSSWARFLSLIFRLHSTGINIGVEFYMSLISIKHLVPSLSDLKWYLKEIIDFIIPDRWGCNGWTNALDLEKCIKSILATIHQIIEASKEDTLLDLLNEPLSIYNWTYVYIRLADILLTINNISSVGIDHVDIFSSPRAQGILLTLMHGSKVLANCIEQKNCFHIESPLFNLIELKYSLVQNDHRLLLHSLDWINALATAFCSDRDKEMTKIENMLHYMIIRPIPDSSAGSSLLYTLLSVYTVISKDVDPIDMLPFWRLLLNSCCLFARAGKDLIIELLTFLLLFKPTDSTECQDISWIIRSGIDLLLPYNQDLASEDKLLVSLVLCILLSHVFGTMSDQKWISLKGTWKDLCLLIRDLLLEFINWVQNGIFSSRLMWQIGKYSMSIVPYVGKSFDLDNRTGFPTKILVSRLLGFNQTLWIISRFLWKVEIIQERVQALDGNSDRIFIDWTKYNINDKNSLLEKHNAVLRSNLFSMDDFEQLGLDIIRDCFREELYDGSVDRWDIQNLHFLPLPLSEHRHIKDVVLDSSLTILFLVPFIIPFKTRVSVFRSFVQESKETFASVRGWNNPPLSIQIRRGHEYEDGYHQLFRVGLNRRIQVTFIDDLGIPEIGIDGGGLFNELLTHLFKYLLGNTSLLFSTVGLRHDTISPIYHEEALRPENLMKYEFIGSLVAKALYEDILLEPRFSLLFLMRWKGMDKSLQDVALLDAKLLEQLSAIKDANIDSADAISDLSLTFTVLLPSNADSAIHGGSGTIRALIPQGQDISVTFDNRIRYVYILARDKLNAQMELQAKSFLKGLHSLLSPTWIRLFTPSDLQCLISGDLNSFKIDWQDWKNHTVYNGYTGDQDQTIIYFWSLIKEMSAQELSDLLFFATGCTRPPLFGFKELNPNFCIALVPMDLLNDSQYYLRLPTVNTCNHMLHLPRYTSKEMLKERLIYAINSKAGFYLA